jgi:integrase
MAPVTQPTESKTWSELSDYAWEEIKPTLACPKSYACHLREFSRRWGTQPAESVNLRTLTIWLAERRLTVTDATVRHKVAALRRVLEIGTRDGILSANPATDLKVPTGFFHRTGWITVLEELALLEEMGPAWGSIAQFACLTGLRLGEQMALVRADIDLQGELVTVRVGKTRQTRSVPLHPTAALIAEEWMEAHGDQLVFLPQYQTRRDLAGIRCSKYLRRATERTQIGRPIWWRDWRHTFASRLVQKGVSLFVVQRLLGHTNPKMTMRYADVGASPLRDAVMLL